MRIERLDFTAAEWDEMINVDLKSAWLCMKYEIPHMLKQGKGAIVNTSSAAGLVGSRFTVRRSRLKTLSTLNRELGKGNTERGDR
jgi:NAD(P)-dependent dehydrogenase (short-subunit alcohol dehydrogenase family)